MSIRETRKQGNRETSRQGLALFTCLLVCLSTFLSACAPTSAPAGPLRVVATFSLLGDFARVVGGDKIALTTLVGPGVDTHTFTPTPADAKALAEAQVVLENGAEFEGWLDDLYVAADARATRVVVTKDIELLAATHDADHGARDPHVWHSVANAMQMVKTIRDALVSADPANAAVYEANAAAYLAELEMLEKWVFEQVNTLPVERRKLVTTHDTFEYFAQRYGFEVIGAVLPTSTEGAAPSAEVLAALVETVRAAGVSAVFAENVSNERLIQQLADETGVRVVPLYTDALGAAGSGADTYLTMMRFNVTAIVTALQNP